MIIANNASIMPQLTFINPDGLSEPFDVNIPNTYVAESAEVIKNIATTIIVKMLKGNPNEKCSNTANVAVSVLNDDICAI